MHNDKKLYKNTKYLQKQEYPVNLVENHIDPSVMQTE